MPARHLTEPCAGELCFCFMGQVSSCAGAPLVIGSLKEGMPSEDPLEMESFSDQLQDQADQRLCKGDWPRSIGRLSTEEDAPRWILLLAGSQVLLDKLEEQSHRFAHGVTENLQFAVREASELLANEWIEDQRAKGWGYSRLEVLNAVVISRADQASTSVLYTARGALILL